MHTSLLNLLSRVFNSQMVRNELAPGLRTDAAGGAYSGPSDILAGLRCKGRERNGEGENEGREGRGRMGKK